MRRFSAGAWVKRFLLRIVLVMAVFWGGGIACSALCRSVFGRDG
jgi:hypothetical protein